MRVFSVVDASNLMHRAHWAVRSDDPDDLVGSALDIFFRSMRKVHDKFGADHAVVCFDHFSWRRVVVEEYKANRREEEEADPDKAESKRLIAEALDDLRVFLSSKTNVTVLHEKLCEGDDFIGRWIARHPEDRHVIVSTDSDYKQLVSDTVEIYNGVSNTLTTSSGVYYQDGMRAKKTERSVTLYGEEWKVKKLVEEDPYAVDPKWSLFEKVMLGDKGDNVSRAAPPGVGPAKLKKLLADRVAMDKFMIALRKDLPGEPSVRELVARNEMLIDLTKQPEEVVEILDSAIDAALSEPEKIGVGGSFFSFCRSKRLVRLMQEANQFTPMLSSRIASPA